MFRKKDKRQVLKVTAGQFAYEFKYRPDTYEGEVVVRSGEGFSFTLRSPHQAYVMLLLMAERGEKDAMANFGTILYSVASLLITDTEFAGDVVAAINAWSIRQDAKAMDNATQVYKEAEEASMALMTELADESLMTEEEREKARYERVQLLEEMMSDGEKEEDVTRSEDIGGA